MRLVRNPARRIEPHTPRREPCAQVACQVAGGTIVANHHKRRARRVSVGKRCNREWAQRGRHEGVSALMSKPSGTGVLIDGAK